MKLGLTIFRTIYDNKTHRTMLLNSWSDLEQLLYNLSAMPGYKPKRGDDFAALELSSPLITPALFNPDSTRANKNVISWAGWCAIDVDNYPVGGFKQAVDLFRGHKFVCYSSASSTVEHPKFRIVLPLSAPVLADKIKHFWFALNKEFNALADPQTKDLSRMYYVPAQYPAANNFIFSNSESNTCLNPFELMEKHNYIDNSAATNNLLTKLPERMQQMMEEYRKSNLVNNKYEWHSYKNCKFVNRKLIQEYRLISSTGWYSKMYSIMVSIAHNAIKSGYPISAAEICKLCQEIDSDTGGWYKDRALNEEAARAISYVLRR